MGVFHTVCTLLSVNGKKFKDAGLRDICIESGVIAEGSVTGVLEGRKYNRAVRFHKLMYEALQRLIWKGFQAWVEEKFPAKTACPRFLCRTETFVRQPVPKGTTEGLG